MATRREILLVYMTAFLQGGALVVVPSASSVLTDPAGFAFSDAQYGLLFVPQVIFTIISAVLGPVVSRTLGLKQAFLIGLLLNLCAMGLFAVCAFVPASPMLAFYCLLAGTGAVGAAFGLILPLVNIYAERFFPRHTASAVAALHTLLGLGTALTPLLVAGLVNRGGWWMMPMGAFVLFAFVLAGSCWEPLKGARLFPISPDRRTYSLAFPPKGVALFLLTIFVYGFCETLFTNWAVLFLKKERAVSLVAANTALGAYWSCVTLGRLCVFVAALRLDPRYLYRVFPFLIVAALLSVTLAVSPWTGIAVFAFAGLACSGFFPLTFSLAIKRFPYMAETVSGSLMAFYVCGYGVASYGVGHILETFPVTLEAVYLKAIFPALGIIALAFVLTQEMKPVNDERTS